HFEFGLDRRPINLGDAERVRAIQAAWARGDDACGLAWYWAMVYDYLADLLANDTTVRAATLVVRFEDMCDRPAETLEAVFRHAPLPDAAPLIERYAAQVRRPDYYQSPLGGDDTALIRSETAAAAARWGYG